MNNLVIQTVVAVMSIVKLGSAQSADSCFVGGIRLNSVNDGYVRSTNSSTTFVITSYNTPTCTKVTWSFISQSPTQVASYDFSTSKAAYNPAYGNGKLVVRATTISSNQADVTFQINQLSSSENNTKIAASNTATSNVTIQVLIIKDCSSPTPNNVPVNPSSGVYNTQANFQCSHGSTLFYINGTTGNTATKCLATAEWENEKIVQCWSAPTATLIGNNTICAGNIATFQCTASGGVPSLDRVEIYFNNQKQMLVGNTWTSNPLSSSNNGDIVECRAINSYTAMQEYTNLGRDSKTLNVHYAAEGFAVNDGTTSHSNICTWYIAPPGPRSCTITFSLNPTTYTTTLTKDGAMVTNDATNQPQTSTSQSFVFTRNQPSFNDSGNYTLKINNGIFENTFTFNISVIYEVQPTPPPPIPPPDNLGVIIGAAVGGVVGFIIIIIFVVYCLRWQINKEHKDKEVTGRSNIGMEAEHGYYEVADRSPYQNEQNIRATQSTNYENLKDNVNVTRDEQGYADIQGVGPSVV
uniref:Basement membrane-specific heparan sulfate proteoglycan core protein-like n=1 Tax=Ciona intestinalis TaxID=7719 RepID=F6QRE5_CIOIN